MFEIQQLFAHNAEAIKALKLMREVALEYKTIEQVAEELRREPELEVEIIAPRPIPAQRRLSRPI